MPNKTDMPRWPLRSRMLLTLGLAFALVFLLAEAVLILGIPLANFPGLWARQEQEAAAQLAAIADARKQELGRWVEERRGDVLVHGENPAFQRDVLALVREASAGGEGNEAEAGEARARLRRHLHNILETYYGEYEKIELIGAESGIVLLSTSPGEEGSDASREEYVVAALNPTVEEVVMVSRGAWEQAPSLNFCRAIHAPSPGEKMLPLAVLVFHNSTRNLIASLLHQGIGRTGEIVLVDQDQRLVTPLRYPLASGEKAQPLVFVNRAEPATLAAQGVEAILTELDYRGVKVLAVTRHLRVTSELGWGLVVKMDHAEVLEPILRNFFFQLAVVAAALLVTAGGLLLIVNHFTRPLDTLSRAAASIEGGDFTVRVDPIGSRETWVMARAFNAMADRLEGWHAELTREVQRRTEELSQVNIDLMESEARFRSLFENVHVVTLLIDPTSGGIVDANTAAAAFYGWSVKELRAMTISQINTLSEEEVEREMRAAAQEERGYFHFRHRLADDTTREVEVYSGPIQSGGRTLLCSIVHDITQRQAAEAHREKLEEQLRQAAKMEAVGRLAGGVAHDFNNMLSVILGYVEMLKEDFTENEGVMQRLLEIEKAGNRSKDITRQLLGFSRKQTICPVPLDLNGAVNGIRRHLGRLTGEDIEFVFRPGEGLWRILIDPSQVDQVLMNLAVNARDAMPTGGKFIIETGNLHLDEEYCRTHAELRPGDYVMLTVSDTGCGMDRETQAHIFEPFFTTKEVGKGTGLGLATVFGIVRQNRGGLGVHSEPGQGTTFRIYLPRLDEQAEGQGRVEVETEVAGHGEGRILLVEDEDQVRRMTTRMLATMGYSVTAAASPQEALRLCQSMDPGPDLLLTDVVMPGMSGRELSDLLAQRWPDMKCVFMSGYTAELLAPHNVVAAETHFLQKPFVRKDLARKIGEVMSHREERHAASPVS